MSQFDELIEQGRRRHAAFTRMCKPFPTILWICSTMLWIYRFWNNYGEITFSLLGLAALTFILVYYATPFSGIKLLSQRALALLIDFSLISAVLFISISWYHATIPEPGDILQIHLGQVLMLALWLAFLYFVLFDWRFEGTLGKRFLGLTVMAVESKKVSFAGSFIRSFLSLPLPVIGAVLLNQRILGESESGAGIFNQSAIRIFMGDALKIAILSFVPMSVMFLEGNQSIADRLTGTAVRLKHGAVNLPSKIKSKTWILLCSSTLAWALLFASFTYLAAWRPMLSGPSKPASARAQVTRIVADPELAGRLWTILPMGLKEPMFGIRRIDFLEESPNPFTFGAKDSYLLAPVNPEPYFKTVERIHSVRVTLTSEARLQIKMLVAQNFAVYVSRSTPVERRPTFSLLQIGTEEQFGLFSINRRENLLLCLMRSGNNAVDFYADVRPHWEIQFPISLDGIVFLMLGAGIPH